MKRNKEENAEVVTLTREVRVTPRWLTRLTFFALQNACLIGICAAFAFKDLPDLPVDAYRGGGYPLLARLVIRIIAIVSVYLVLTLSIDTMFVMGPRAFRRAFVKNASLSSRSWKSLKLYGIAGMAVLLGIIAYFTYYPYGVYIFWFSAVAAAFPVYYTLMPPVALVLGASEEHAGRAYAIAYEACQPLKVAYLLRDDCMPRSHMDVGLPQQSYRTYSIAEWQVQVQALLKIVPVVVFDLRTPTPHVATEIAMVARNLQGKDVILVETEEHPELGDSYQLISSQALSTVSSDDQIRCLMKYLWNARYGLDRIKAGRQ